jgi:hypothetical protein
LPGHFLSVESFMVIVELVDAETAKPIGLAPAGRRITARLLRYWTELRGNRTFPKRGQIQFEAIPELSEYGFTMSVNDPGSNPVLHRLGSELRKHVDLSLNAQSIYRSDNKILSLALNIAIRRYREVIECNGPVAFHSEGYDGPDAPYVYRVIMLPFSEDGRQIDFILGAIRFQQRQPETTPADRFESDLTRSLKSCREMVSAWRGKETQSRAILYEALERTYQLHFEAQKEFGVYKALCATYGITIKPQAPFTALIRLVFGNNCDKTRVSEYAACLSYAKRIAQKPGALRALINATEGGVKGCAKAERAARHSDRNEGENGLEHAKTALRQHTPLVKFNVENSVTEEFFLLLGRRGPQSANELEVIGVLNEKNYVVEPILRRAAKTVDNSSSQ